MTTTPPSTPPAAPQPVPSIPPAAPAPAPLQAPAHAGNGTKWVHIGTALGAALSIAGAAYSSFYSGGADRSASQAQQASHEIALTQEMLDKARERASKIEDRLDELEKWRAVEEAEEKVRREGTRERSP